MMKLSAQTRQELSLQLSTSNALDNGLDEIHLLANEYKEDIVSGNFSKEIKRLFVSANNKRFFSQMSENELLRSEISNTERVINFAINHHKSKFRDSGYPYVAHVLSAGFLLARLGFPKEIVYSAILHDTVEETGDKIAILNELYKINPAVAWYVFSVSGADTTDAVEKDRMLMKKIEAFSSSAGNIFPKAIKCADGIANLYDVEFMQARDGRSAKERQLRFIRQTENEILPFAKEVDEAGVIRVQKKKEIFSLEEYAKEAITFKLQIIDGDLRDRGE